ncbi:MAG: hypothetical protein CMH51_04810 [Myxococcales bacterium]|jgi:hypothetical protein|nr:hypothetical protein [Myxococcales bacterium]MAR44959.1 hypothetical protein [Gemmatimonadaceae bacterium]
MALGRFRIVDLLKTNLERYCPLQGEGGCLNLNAAESVVNETLYGFPVETTVFAPAKLLNQEFSK